VATATIGDLRLLRHPHPRPADDIRQREINRYYSCAYHDPVLAGGPERVCSQQRIRADELDRFVYDKIRDVLLRPDVLLAGETALAGREGARRRTPRHPTHASRPPAGANRR